MAHRSTRAKSQRWPMLVGNKLNTPTLFFTHLSMNQHCRNPAVSRSTKVNSRKNLNFPFFVKILGPGMRNKHPAHFGKKWINLMWIWHWIQDPGRKNSDQGYGTGSALHDKMYCCVPNPYTVSQAKYRDGKLIAIYNR